MNEEVIKNLVFIFLTLLSSKLYAQPAAVKVPVLSIVDSINVGTTEYFLRHLRQVEDSKAPALVLWLDTPGGLLESTREIVQALLKTKVKVIVWVRPEGARAASAGAMITLAAHMATMSPATSIGAASPVMVGGGGDETSKLSDTMKSKITNDTLAFVEGIAKERGRNTQWARKFVADASSLNSDMALKYNLIDAVVTSQEQLWKETLQKFPDLPANVIFENIEPNLKETILSFISNPNVAYGLLGLGTLGLYIEMTNPGLVIPGTIGAVSLALGAISLKILPIRPGAVALLVVALILLCIEFLTPLPTYGVAGTLGIASLLMSGLFLMDRSQTDLGLSPALWLPMFFLVSAFMVFLGFESLKAIRAKPYLQGAHALIGEMGVVSKTQKKGLEGLVKIHGGELWSAEVLNPDEGPLVVGEEVKVVQQKGLRLLVSKKRS